MPDKSDQNKRAHPIGLIRTAGGKTQPRRRKSPPRSYVELRCKSNFSFLRGASHPEELARCAAELGYTALAITDRNTLAGIVRMHCAAKACNLKLIIGAEITPVDALPITLYATDRAAYGRLVRIITQGRLRAAKGTCEVTFDDIAELNAGLLATVHGNYDDVSSDSKQRVSAICDYRDILGDRLYLSASVHGGSDDHRHLARMHALACATRVPLVATNDVHYHEPGRRFLQDVLTCIRQCCTLEDAGRTLFANAERHLKPIDEMERIFVDYPQAIARTKEIADRCTFNLDELRYEYPETICPPGEAIADFLNHLTWAGAQARYPKGIPGKVRKLIEHEVKLIGQLNYEPYFLTVWDIVKFARSRGILCQGRGSAANSAVCYCLGITSVNPDRIDILFERFVSAERNEPPDIDVDFEHERREEVFQYIYNRYGREHAGVVAEVITYRPRSAIRDVGKALGLSLDHVGILAKKHEWWDKNTLSEDFVRESGLTPSDRTVRMLRRLVQQLMGFPRHLSQHVGGFVITRGPLCEMVPIENGAMPDRTFIEWDKDDIDALGILKIDCLALGMLTAIRKCFTMIEQWRMANGEWRKNNHDHSICGPQSPIPNRLPLALHTIPQEDPAVYDMICKADTVGVFQIESRAQMSMLPRLKPRKYYDLVIEVAIVRPGPIQGGMVHPYLRRRNGEEPINYPNDAIKEVLHKTLGVPLFQEQAMRLAVVAAGFTPGEADQLRRAMAAWRRASDITRFRSKLIDGMKANGLDEEFAERCFEQICGFGEYGFPESHAASFALLVYVSAWLKLYYPVAFCASIVNSLPMGFYQPAQLVRDAREHGVTVLPVDVNHSGYDCRLERNRNPQSPTRNSQSPAVRLGMRLVKGISPAQVEGIERGQSNRPFTCIADLAQRSGASRATLARLAAADAMGSMGLNRRKAVWQVLAPDDESPMFEGTEPAEKDPRLPEMSLKETVFADYDRMGLSLNAHPMSLVRNELKPLSVQQARVLKSARQGQWIKVAGLVLIRQRPSTAKGIVFCTLEDETGPANLLIRPNIYQKYRPVAHGAVALIAEGRVERQGEVVHLQCTRLENMSKVLTDLHSVSRDFH
ncbi:MAG: error-prone DNA polymerase [Phycisphaerales bacterium]|nr:MAG: error-prone DNA polymerase [Phycisphaerales bacterium]